MRQGIKALRADQFEAPNVQNYQPHRVIVGTVASDPNGNLFEIQANGRRDRVLALYGENPAAKTGARVRIRAFWDSERDLWQASDLRVLSGETRALARVRA